MMANASIKQEAHALVPIAEQAEDALRREDWGAAVRSLTEMQQHVGWLLGAAGDKVHEVLQAPIPDHRDRE
jgi:hypothetical protein